MTSKSEKLRGLFLAALMVFSVFAGTVAFSGSAAAAANTVSIDSAVEYNSGNIEVTFNQSVDSINGVQVEVDQNARATNHDLKAGGQRLVIDAGADVAPISNLTVRVDADKGTNTNQILRAKNAQVTSNDINESAAGTNPKNIYKGETLALVADNSGTDTDVVVSGPNGIEIDGGTSANSEVLPFETTSLQAGSNYSVEFAGTTPRTKFKVSDLGLQASVSKTDIQPGDTINVSASAIRGNSDVTLRITNDDTGAVDREVTQSLGGNAKTKFVNIQIPNGGPGALPYGGNNYTVEVIDDQTAITADAGTVSTEYVPKQNVEIASTETDQRGDISSIVLDVDNNQVPVTLTLGTDNDAYVTNVTAYDADDDGQIVLNWNTFEADNDAANNNGQAYNGTTNGATPQWSTSNDFIAGTNVSTDIAAGQSHIIASGTYEMNARVGGHNDKIGGESIFNSSTDAYQADSVGTVTIEQRGEPELQLWVAPQGTALASAQNLTTAVDAGSLTQDDSVAAGDRLVVQVNADGLEGALETNSLLDLMDTQSTYVGYLNHTQRVGSASNQAPKMFFSNNTLGAADVDTTTQTSDDTYYFAHNTSSMPSINGMNFAAGETYDTELRINSKKKNSANFGLVAPEAGEFNDEVVQSSFDVVAGEGSINTDATTDKVRVRAQADQSITGTTTFAPGTELRVRAQAKTGSSSQFIIGPRTITVDENQEWEMTADFSSYNVGSEFTVTLTNPNTNNQLDTADGQIRGPPQVDTLEFSDQTRLGEKVVVDGVSLNYGGFVAIENADGDVLGVSQYIEEGQSQQNVNIVLDEALESSQTLTAQPYVDSNGNEEFDAGTDEAYPSSASARITLQGAAPNFQLSDLSPQSKTVTAGETISVSATVTNDGNEAGTQDVTLTAGGQTLGTQSVSLDPGASQTVTFSDIDTSALGAGDYTHTVSTDDSSVEGSLTVNAQETEEPTTEEPTTEEPTTEEPGDETTEAEGGSGDDSDDSDGESGPGFGIVVSVLALLAAALLAARRNE